MKWLSTITIFQSVHLGNSQRRQIENTAKSLCWPSAIFMVYIYKPLVNTIFWAYPSKTSHWILFFTIRFLSVCETWLLGYEVRPGWSWSRFIHRFPWTRKCVVSDWASLNHLNPSHLSCRVNHIKKIDFIVWFLVFFFSIKRQENNLNSFS